MPRAARTAQIGILCLTIAVVTYLVLDRGKSRGIATRTLPDIPAQMLPRKAESPPQAPNLAVPDEPHHGDTVSAVASQDIAVRPSPTALHESPFEATLALAHHVADRVHMALRDANRFPELTACGQTSLECEEWLAKALAALLTWPLHDALFHDAYGLAALEATHGPEVVQDLLHQQIEDAYATADAPVDRIVALALLASRPYPDTRPLPSVRFAELASRPAPEAMLLLEHYERAPIDEPEVVRAIGSVATEVSMAPEVRFAAVRALGFAHTATGLEEAVALLDADGLLTRDVALSIVAPALARCSLACVPALVDLARSENPAARLATLVGVARLEPDIREQLVEQIMPSLTAHGALTREEHEQLAYLVHMTTH